MIAPSALLGLLAAAPNLLAPSLEDLDQSLDRTEGLLEQAEEEDVTWSAAQRAWVSARCTMRGGCSTELSARLAVLLRGAARRTRAFAQSARAEWARAERIRAFDAVWPLVGEDRGRRWRDLERRLDRVSQRYAIRLGWNTRFVETWAGAHPNRMTKTECLPDMQALVRPELPK